MLAQVDFHNPLFWAVFVGWIMSVVLHEFAHGLVGFLGGDYTIRERGGLSLNPLQYVDPVYSLLLPAVFLLMGGVPLPGGATFIRRDLLRGRGWDSAVSLAGPATNFLLFLACALPLHPAIGWIDPQTPVRNWSNAQVFLGAMAVLELFSVLLNLVPVPPLDGFGTIAPFMNHELRQKLSTPPLSTMLFFGYFLALWNVPALQQRMFLLIGQGIRALGTDPYPLFQAFVTALWGHA